MSEKQSETREQLRDRVARVMREIRGRMPLWGRDAYADFMAVKVDLPAPIVPTTVDATRLRKIFSDDDRYESTP